MHIVLSWTELTRSTKICLFGCVGTAPYYGTDDLVSRWTHGPATIEIFGGMPIFNSGHLPAYVVKGAF